MCVGVPTKLPEKVDFTDWDMLQGSIGGFLDIKQDRSSKSMDVDSYILRWGKANNGNANETEKIYVS